MQYAKLQTWTNTLDSFLLQVIDREIKSYDCDIK